MRKVTRYLAYLFFALIITSCKKNISKEVSFLTFNVWQEGTSVPNGLDKIRDVIIHTNPDVVCFVEVRNYKKEDWTTKIVNALKKKGQKYNPGYAGGDVSFISKYPIENGKQLFNGKGTVVSFELNVDGNIVLIAGTHLDYTYYASNLPRGYYGSDPNWKMIDDGNGKPKPNTNFDSVHNYNLKSERDDAISSFINAIKSETKPVILMGDFNEPSFQDWTTKTKNMFDHNGLVMPWYTTKKLHNVGFRDAFRKIYPNEVTNPGFTWPSYAHETKSTSWTPLADERERIDFVFYKGENITVNDVAIVGPKELYVHNKIATINTENENFLADKLPWPSDHKAVFAKFSFSFKKTDK